MQHTAFGGSNKMRTCCPYLSSPSTPRLPHTYPSLNPSIWHTHRTRWPGREAEAGARRLVALSGRSSSSLWGKG